MVKHLSRISQGGTVFLDTNILHFYLRGPEDLRKDCTLFLERIDEKGITGFTSSLVLDELMYKILLKKIEEKYRRNPLDVIQKSFEEIGVQSIEVRKALNIILGIEGLNILSVTRAHIEESVDFMQKYSVLPRDAIHLSVMKSIECTDLASADSDFDRVLTINRWTPLRQGELERIQGINRCA